MLVFWPEDLDIKEICCKESIFVGFQIESNHHIVCISTVINTQLMTKKHLERKLVSFRGEILAVTSRPVVLDILPMTENSQNSSSLKIGFDETSLLPYAL